MQQSYNSQPAVGWLPCDGQTVVVLYDGLRHADLQLFKTQMKTRRTNKNSMMSLTRTSSTWQPHRIASHLYMGTRLTDRNRAPAAYPFQPCSADEHSISFSIIYWALAIKLQVYVPWDHHTTRATCASTSLLLYTTSCVCLSSK